MKKIISLLVLSAGMIAGINFADAQERRCLELGTNCVCSEPLNTNSLTFYSDWYYNPADSATKECHAEGGNSGAIVKNGGVTTTNDSTVLGAFPAGHEISYVSRGLSGHTGSFFAGHQFGSSQYLKRSVVRWYQYWSENFQFKGDGVCENSKFAEFQYDTHGDLNTGNLLFYNFVQWSPARDLGIYSSTVPSFNDFRGHWWRFEIVFVNRHGIQTGQNSRVLIYGKNVTDNEDEILLIDTATDYVGKSPAIDMMVMNMYRQGTCVGYTAFSHFMAAGWDSDDGQRIGAALEIEGGQSDPTSPQSPHGLIIR